MKSISKEIKLNLYITIITSFLTFVINKYFAEYMGIRDLSMMKLFSQLISYLNLAELGIGTAAMYELYKYIALKDRKAISSVLYTLEVFYKKVSIYIILGGVIISCFFSIMIKENLNFKIYVIWAVYVVGVLSSYSYAKNYTFFLADQRFVYIKKIQGLSKITIQLLQIIVIIKLKSFVIFGILIILENIILYKVFKKKYYVEYSDIKKNKIINIEIIKNTKYLFWHKIGGLIVFNTDYIIISIFLSLNFVGIYSNYLLLCQAISTILGTITSVLIPKIGEYISVNKKEDIYLYWRKLNILYLFINLVFILCMYKLSDSFIKLWMGNEYIFPKKTLQIIVINLFIQLNRSAIDIFKSGSGFFKDIYSPILESILNLFFSILLVNKIGFNGVILGTLISNVLIIYLLKPILVFKNCFDKKIKDYFWYIFYQNILIIISVFITLNVINKINIIEIKNWLDWLVFSTKTGVLVTFSLLFCFSFCKEFRNILIENLKQIFKIKKVKNNIKK